MRGRGSRRVRLKQLEDWLQDLSQRKDHLERLQGDHAPASETDRLNLAFEHLARKAPISEVERLDEAYQLIAQKAPISEVDRLNQAYELISKTASERAVEAPWALSKYRGEEVVLEVGYAYAEEHYLRALGSLGIDLLVGLDLVQSPRPKHVLEEFQEVRGDVLSGCFQAGSFELIFCISTIEHIGRDNRVYGADYDRADPDADILGMATIGTWLRPGGRLLLTVLFGRFEDKRWLINYDRIRLEALMEASGLDVSEARYFGWVPGGWQEVSADSLANHGYKSLGAVGASGVALLELTRQGEVIGQ